MLTLVVGTNKKERTQHIHTIVSPEADVLVFDETMGELADLEQYLYPSLFMTEAPVVLVKYMLGGATLESVFIKKLLASPTVFIFEEIEIPATSVTPFKKAGAIIHAQEKQAPSKKEHDIFTVIAALTAPDKKARWIAFRDALEHHPIEALVGILYWKVRDLYNKTPKQKAHYEKLYRALLGAHADAWKRGTPLELAIEKVLLMQ